MKSSSVFEVILNHCGLMFKTLPHLNCTEYQILIMVAKIILLANYWIDYPSIFHNRLSSTMIFSMGNTSNVKKVLKNETKLTCWFFCSHLTHKNNKNADFMSLMNIVVLVTSIDHLPLLVFSWSDLVKIHPNPGKKFHSNYLWVWFI